MKVTDPLLSYGTHRLSLNLHTSVHQGRSGGNEGNWSPAFLRHTSPPDGVCAHATELYVEWFLWAWHLINDCLCTSTAPSLSHSPLSTPSEYRWFVNVPFIKFMITGITKHTTTKHDLTVGSTWQLIPPPFGAVQSTRSELPWWLEVILITSWSGSEWWFSLAYSRSLERREPAPVVLFSTVNRVRFRAMGRIDNRPPPLHLTKNKNKKFLSFSFSRDTFFRFLVTLWTTNTFFAKLFQHYAPTFKRRGFFRDTLQHSNFPTHTTNAASVKRQHFTFKTV